MRSSYDGIPEIQIYPSFPSGLLATYITNLLERVVKHEDSTCCPPSGHVSSPSKSVDLFRTDRFNFQSSEEKDAICQYFIFLLDKQ